MTPFERSQQVIRLSSDGTLTYAGLLIDDIATAMRAAENDALERAAVALEAECWVRTPAMVRALKHKETT